MNGRWRPSVVAGLATEGDDRARAGEQQDDEQAHDESPQKCCAQVGRIRDQLDRRSVARHGVDAHRDGQDPCLVLVGHDLHAIGVP